MQATRAIGELRVAVTAGNAFVTARIVGAQLFADEVGAVFSVPMFLFTVVANGLIVARYRAHRKSAPDVSQDRLAIQWMIGNSALNAALTLHAILALASR